MRQSTEQFRLMAGGDIRGGEWCTLDPRTGTIVPETVSDAELEDRRIDAAARAMWNADPLAPLPWSDTTWSAERMRRRFRRLARAALTAGARV